MDMRQLVNRFDLNRVGARSEELLRRYGTGVAAVLIGAAVGVYAAFIWSPATPDELVMLRAQHRLHQLTAKERQYKLDEVPLYNNLLVNVRHVTTHVRACGMEVRNTSAVDTSKQDAANSEATRAPTWQIQVSGEAAASLACLLHLASEHSARPTGISIVSDKLSATILVSGLLPPAERKNHQSKS